MTILPDNYEVPKSEGNYMKFRIGENTFRILSEAIVGWEAWKDSKPLRFKLDEKPTDCSEFENEKVNHFWAFAVYNYNAKKIQVLEITQKGIQVAIKALIDNKKWGDPKKFDITVAAEGEKLERTYITQPNPHTDLDEEIMKEYMEKSIKLEALFTGDDPFGEKKKEEEVDLWT